MQRHQLEQFVSNACLAVDPDSIERGLAELWREAGKSSVRGQPVTRACLWNVVVHLDERFDDPSDMTTEFQQALSGLPRYLANRTIVLKTRKHVEGERELTSWISANCIPAGLGKKLVCSEEITLAARGEGLSHLPSLVESLKVSDLPIALVLGSRQSEQDEWLARIARSADRVIYDSDQAKAPAPPPICQRPGPMGRSMDLGWVRTSDFRASVQELGGPPIGPDDINRLKRIVVGCPPNKQASGCLLLAWMGSALGGTRVHSGSQTTWHMARDGLPSIELVQRVESSFENFEVSLITPATTQPWGITTEGDAYRVSIPGTEDRLMPVEPKDAASCLARSIRSRTEDQALTSALRIAEQF